MTTLAVCAQRFVSGNGSRWSPSTSKCMYGTNFSRSRNARPSVRTIKISSMPVTPSVTQTSGSLSYQICASSTGYPTSQIIRCPSAIASFLTSSSMESVTPSRPTNVAPTSNAHLFATTSKNAERLRVNKKLLRLLTKNEITS